MHTQSILLNLYESLLAHFGKQYWWPGDSPFEIAIGAVLTQNTNWVNVEKAIDNLKRNNLIDAAKIVDIDSDALANLIKPSGYFNLKSGRLKNMAYWWQKNAETSHRNTAHLATIRNDLLQVKGIGPETADSILLYALDIPTFVVDAYTKRVLLNHTIIDASATYADVKNLFESVIPPNLVVYKEFHALFVAVGKHFCKPKPRCANCCLNWHLE